MLKKLTNIEAILPSSVQGSLIITILPTTTLQHNRNSSQKASNGLNVSQMLNWTEVELLLPSSAQLRLSYTITVEPPSQPPSQPAARQSINIAGKAFKAGTVLGTALPQLVTSFVMGFRNPRNISRKF